MEIKPGLWHIFKKYGDLEIFRDLSIEFLPGRINCILGPSGCGKTTLLNIISGAISLDKGDREYFENLSLSYVFQDPRLLPWKTVYGNIAFVLKDRFEPQALENRVNEHIARVSLGTFRDYYPSRLSGGMKQRVALARAFSFDSDVILMDEAFKALDIKLKDSLTRQFLDLWENDPRTVIFVTHDVDEAVKVGERIIILGSPPDGITGLLDNPAREGGAGLKKNITALMTGKKL
jgi:NitT/TauT family transport system ATP-binding protein